jgi:hypothetical protein
MPYGDHPRVYSRRLRPEAHYRQLDSGERSIATSALQDEDHNWRMPIMGAGKIM